jgi:hypothetical protein
MVVFPVTDMGISAWLNRKYLTAFSRPTPLLPVCMAERAWGWPLQVGPSSQGGTVGWKALGRRQHFRLLSPTF